MFCFFCHKYSQQLTCSSTLFMINDSENKSNIPEHKQPLWEKLNMF